LVKWIGVKNVRLSIIKNLKREDLKDATEKEKKSRISLAMGKKKKDQRKGD
jgi:hypothetical protein